MGLRSCAWGESHVSRWVDAPPLLGCVGVPCLQIHTSAPAPVVATLPTCDPMLISLCHARVMPLVMTSKDHSRIYLAIIHTARRKPSKRFWIFRAHGGE